MRKPRRFEGPFLAFTLLLTPFACRQNAPTAQRNVPQRAASQQTKDAASAAPQVGDVAPPFRLKTLDGKQEVELASLRGKRPVVLFFGSYT